jgi:hypothetical protein
MNQCLYPSRLLRSRYKQTQGRAGPGSAVKRVVEDAADGEPKTQSDSGREHIGFRRVLRYLDNLLDHRHRNQRAAQQYLVAHSWRRATSQYLRVLAGRARIEGVAIDAATTPLVQ